jgi:hypothetical protein
MFNKFKNTFKFIIPLVFCVSLSIPLFSSIYTNNNIEKNKNTSTLNSLKNTISIGCEDGTDWQGYISGSIQCAINPFDNSSAILISNNKYISKNLIIPD